MKTTHAITLFPLLLLACSGAQSGDDRGEVFCESYEENFIGQCRTNCDATTEGKPAEVSKKCLAKCKSDLKEDDTFASDCGDRADKL
jgi:hypothetical protein